MEASITMEVNEFIEGVKEQDGNPISNVKERLMFSVVNALWTIATGNRFKQHDQGLINFTESAVK